MKLAACIGNQFDLETLAVVCEDCKENVAINIWSTLQEGLILPISEAYKFFHGSRIDQKQSDNVSVGYRFLHDRVQQAAYALISEEDKQATHLKIGRLLWHNISNSEQENYLFTIVNHLNIGCDLILDPLERDRIAQLNFQASQKAKSSVAYEASRGYCYKAQLFMSEESWEENYSFRFALAIATIEAEYFTHNLDVAQHLSQETLKKARNLLDQVKIHELQILFEINQNRMNEAISLALEVLFLLGINLATETKKIQAEIELLRREIKLPTAEIANLVNIEIIDDEEKLVAIQILTNASSAAYIANPTLYPAIVIHTVRNCIKHGHSSLAASAYSWYGALLCGVYDEIEAGYEFGKLSLKLLEKFNAYTFAAKVSNMFNVFIRPWKEHISHAIAALPEAIQSGFDNGDVEYAFYAAVHYCNYLFYSGSPLDTVFQAQESYLPSVIKAQYEFHEGFLRINQQVVSNLLGETDKPQYLQGLVLDGEKCLSQWLQNNIVF